MRIIACFVALLLIPQMTFASTQDLKAIIDDYTYAMTVEWDQTDKEFAQKKTDELRTSLQELDLEEITLNDLKQIFPMIREDMFKDEFEIMRGMDLSELETFLIKNESLFYQKGSSWDGEITFPIIFIGFFVTVLAINIYRDQKYGNCVLSGGLLVRCSN